MSAQPYPPEPPIQQEMQEPPQEDPSAEADAAPEQPSGRRAVATYGFKEDAAKGLNPAGKGWSLVYETPAPLVEFKVPFVLENIPLP